MTRKQIIAEQAYPAGTGAAAYEKRLDLGIEVKRVLGYYVIVVQNGGLTPEQLRVSFANASRTIFEPVGLGHLMVNQSVAIKERYFTEEPFDVNGYINSKLYLPAPTTSPLVVQYMLLVEAD